MGDMLVHIIIEELQRQVLHLRLDLIQTQTVRHRRMQRLRLFRDMTTTLRIPFRVQLTQQFQPLIEDVKKNFIAVFHTGLIKKSLQR